MKKLAVVFFAGCLLFLSANAAWAPCPIEGYVFCDVNQNGVIDEGDTPFADVDIIVDGVTISTTNIKGYYYALEHEVCGDKVSLDVTTLPDDAFFIDPQTNEVDYSFDLVQNWLINSEICHPQEEGACWFTAGGVKFESITGTRMATNPNSKGGGPKDSVGGVAYPSCSPFPSNGGQWNHVAHSLKLHLIGKDITVIRCGNVDGIEPGSESPVCPLNFIEFVGTGIVKGIHGNHIEDIPVTFFVRAEDHNEPGNEQAVNSNDGADVDRYFLRVVDGDGILLILVDEDGIDDNIVDPLTITGGNFQMHCTSCD